MKSGALTRFASSADRDRNTASAPSAAQRAQTSAYLLALPFPAFALLIAQLLKRLGYQEVSLRGTTARRGRNRYGGLDIEAFINVGLTKSRVICQLRQYDREPVSRLNIDVLRGAMLRTGAIQGLLVTTSTFAPAAIEAAQAAQHLAPVRLIAGEELAHLVQSHGLGRDKPTLRKINDRKESRAVVPPLPPTPPVCAPPSCCPASADRCGLTIRIVVDPMVGRSSRSELP